MEKWVNAFKKSTGAKNIGVIVEDPSSGEILAMDGGDRYDLNDPRNLSSLYSADEIAAMNDSETMDALSAMWNNFCVTDVVALLKSYAPPVTEPSFPTVPVVTVSSEPDDEHLT